MVIGIIGAMSVEIDGIKAKVRNASSREISGCTFVSGRMGKNDVVVVQCGIGKVNAALCAQTLIMTWHPDLVINVGVGGSLCADLKYGDIAIADKLVQHDVDTSPIGDPVGFVSTVNKIYFECDPCAVERIKAVVDGMDGLRGRVGTIASGDQFVNSGAVKNTIVERFNAISCEMEGGAVSQVCCVNGVKCAVIRSISDNADDDSHSDYGQFMKMAAERSTAVICRLMETV